MLAAVLQATALAQKTPDPEARNKRSVSVAPIRHTNSVQTHRSEPQTTSVPKSGSSSARDLAKIERASVQQIKATHKTKPSTQAVPGTKPQTQSKPMKFSYHPPTAAGKPSAKNSAPAPGRSPRNP